MITLDEVDDDNRWCGVFQGGGAKGAAYAGAAKALRKRKLWFDAVAGASAGALTAALIAAGYDETELERHTDTLLKCIAPASGIDRLLARIPLARSLVRYSSAKLEVELESLLRKAIQRDASTGPITFSDLYKHTHIRLYVVATDSTTGTPVLFCEEVTPSLSVSAAVLASCALPVAFEARYGACVHGEFGAYSGAPLRRLQDGGLWANFPSFVFTDAAFRTYNNLPALTAPRVLGFTLSTPRVISQPDRFVDVPRKRRRLAELLVESTSAKPIRADRPLLARAAIGTASLAVIVAGGLFGVGVTSGVLGWQGTVVGLTLIAGAGLLGVASSEFVRYLLTHSNLIPAVLIGAAGFLGYCAIASARSGLSTVLARTIAGVAGVAIALLILVAAVLIERVRSILFSGGVDAALTMLGQATRPTLWLDSLPASHTVYVDPDPLVTTGFRIKPAVLSQVIKSSYESCLAQLDEILLGHQNDLRSRLQVLFKDPQMQAMLHALDLSDGLRVFPEHRI